MEEKKLNRKCLGCIFYSGVECHGHGDFWGTCSILAELIVRRHKMIMNKYNTIYDSFVYDNTECKFKDFKESDFSKMIMDVIKNEKDI